MKKQAVVFCLAVLGAACQGQQEVQITVSNPTEVHRRQETIQLDWMDVQKHLPNLGAEEAAVLDVQTHQPLMAQVLKIDGRTALLFQTTLEPGQKKQFILQKRPEGMEPPASPITTYCRFIPERKDDFGWENDKVAFRVYGPALEDETITSGIDAWGKCVPYPVIDKFIRDYNEKQIPYHYDHGEGGDFYKVGNTLGCGGLAPFVDGKVCLPSHNFAAWKILGNGPIRSVFELTYRPWQAGPYTVSEVKRISIDLGSQMSRIECTYTCSQTDTLPLAAGIVLRETSRQTWTAPQSIAYWLPTDFIKGFMGCGVVFGAEWDVKPLEADGHLLLTLQHKIDKPVVYYAGSCWDKNEEFNTFEKWQQYLKIFKQQLDHPVAVEWQP
ncbi:MAG TPA: DUF4861 family protein [Anaerohalosphaeraceae bacterium]|nr:DUF4861 family protein [Anaerohalosphaeraceae bacterium]HQG06546.1 DUF4861 family protein [Anaerohalosphaeraceae bacterium]HQI08060.1 DUF4861 family protein [Anaerohalosphaeraceae bacterium]HQJ68361.1 DUF4861 family protein [Anaerohalosphaeraceae bacterium]